jgi:predicted dehydrogenase
MKLRFDLTRREFILSSAAAGTAATFTIVNPESVRGTQANSAVTIGWVGLGGRGTADAKGLATAGARIVALGDVFQERIDAARKIFSNVEDNMCFVGFDAYKKVCEQKVDAVLLVTPPGFRPDEFRTAVAAGKHIFAEKPLAVDTWGCRDVLANGEIAKSKNLSVVVGLQRRYATAYQQAQKLITGGQLGTIVTARGFYLTGDVWKGKTWPRNEFPTEQHWMARNWYYFRSLSGDLITEQNIHNLDALNWVLGSPPERCIGYGGRKWRKYIGDIFDHFNLTYEYPGGVHLTFMSGQFATIHDSSEQVLGTEGTFSTTGGMRIEGKNPWKYEGDSDSNKNEWEAFVNSVRNNQPRADTKHAVDGTFTTILGREAAYTRQEVEWKKLWEKNEKLERKAYPVES